MISEIEALAVLDAVAEARGKLGPEEIRATAILASLFAGKLVRYDSVLESVLILQQKGFIQGDSEHLQVTPNGKALLHALGERKIGSTRLESLRKLAEPLSNAPSTLAFVQDYGPRVTDMVRAQETKLVSPSGEIVLCAMLLHVEGTGDLYRSSFVLPAEMRAADANPWPAIHRMRAQLSKESDTPLHATLDGDRLLLEAPRQLSSIEVDGRRLTCDSSKKLDTHDAGPYVAGAVQEFIEARLIGEGYSPAGSMRRVFVRYASRKKDDESAIPAVRLSYQILGPTCLLVWTEAFSKPWTRTLDLIGDMRTKDEVRARLEGRSFRTLPYEQPARLLDVVPEVDLGRERVPKTQVNYLDYWAELGYELEERLQPILVMQTKTGRYHYPAETVLIRAEVPEVLGARAPLVMTPDERHRALTELARIVFPTNLMEWRGLRIGLDSVAPTVDEIPPEWRPRVASINPPLLRFAHGQYSGDPLDVFSKGPEAGRKPISVRSVYYPSHANAERCAKAVEILCRHYGSRGFGEARVDPAVQKISYAAGTSGPELGALIRRTAAPGGTEAVGVAFLDEGDEAYYAFKRFYPEYSGAPLQAIQLETMPAILAGKRSLLDQLALNLYLKRLEQKESAWTLLSPAGGSEKTSFVAIAFSRRLEPRRGGKGVAVLHDAMGRGLNWNMVMTPGERTITEAWFNTVLDQVQPLLEGEPFERLVLYRAGHLYPAEVQAIKKSLDGKLKSRKIRIDFVAVMNEHRRFFVRTDGALWNPPPGTAIFWSNEEVLLSESGFAERGIWRGTVVPVGLKRVLGSTDMSQIAAEYHDLTHLSWSAPYTTWKHPLVMKIAERLAEASREGVPASAIRFLPL